MSVLEYQNEIAWLLNTRLHLDATVEWRAQMQQGLYSPRVDVAAGPFSLANGQRHTMEHLDLFRQREEFFRQLCIEHLSNLNEINQGMSEEQITELVQQKMHSLEITNMNARCFLAIEIENNVSRKHLMGGGINCACLGKVGIAIGFNQEMHRAFLNLYRYFKFLEAVDKPTFNTRNLLIISRQQLLDILSNINVR